MRMNVNQQKDKIEEFVQRGEVIKKEEKFGLSQYKETFKEGMAYLRLEPGLMAIALYYGKENGYEERDAILEHLKTLDDHRYSVLCCQWSNRRSDPPMPIFIWKER